MGLSSAVGERDAQLHTVKQESQGWMERCKAAEDALSELRIVNGQLDLERLSVAERLRDAEHAVDAMRASATWRWSQQVARNSLVQGVFGGVIRAVAERSNASSARGPTAASAAPAMSEPRSRVQTSAQQMMARHGFLGVPVETFEQAGRSQLTAMLNEGLNPESKVLDFGCGRLRIAYWLIRFLDPGRYYGIEPARERVEYGLQYLFTREEVKLRQPRFDFNARFDSSVFSTKFDFFLARSIWTHAGKSQIEASLDSFVRDSTAASVFLASYLPAKSPEDDYSGDHWVGTSHESDTPGVIRHSLAWIMQQCNKRMLRVAELPGLDCDSQLWLRIRRQ